MERNGGGPYLALVQNKAEVHSDRVEWAGGVCSVSGSGGEWISSGRRGGDPVHFFSPVVFCSLLSEGRISWSGSGMIEVGRSKEHCPHAIEFPTITGWDRDGPGAGSDDREAAEDGPTTMTPPTGNWG